MPYEDVQEGVEIAFVEEVYNEEGEEYGVVLISFKRISKIFNSFSITKDRLYREFDIWHLAVYLIIMKGKKRVWGTKKDI